MMYEYRTCTVLSTSIHTRTAYSVQYTRIHTGLYAVLVRTGTVLVPYAVLVLYVSNTGIAMDTAYGRMGVWAYGGIYWRIPAVYTAEESGLPVRTGLTIDYYGTCTQY